MNSDYYTLPAGTPEHYAAYEELFRAADGTGFPVPGDPRASYEIDHSWEIAPGSYQFPPEGPAAHRRGAEAAPAAGPAISQPGAELDRDEPEISS
jgi:hypothetical protein